MTSPSNSLFDPAQNNPRSGLQLRRSVLAKALSAVFVTALVAACGGGGSSGDAPAANANNAAPASFGLGPVSGFGSVIVGGVRYDDSQASVSDEDGQTIAGSAVKLGVMLQVSAGKLDAANATAVAQNLMVVRELAGPVTSVDATASTVQVLGQTVLINANTVFDSGLAAGFSALTVGSVIEVHGIADATSGNITATRIEPKTGATFYALRGTVAALNTTSKTFKIGTAVISYADLGAADVPSSLADGLVVRIKFKTVQANGVWVATSLRTGKRVPDAAQDAHVEGAITVFTSTSSFEINGLKVDASKASFPDGTAGIALGAKVEVSGSVVAGVLVATKVQLEEAKEGGGNHAANPRPLELHGAIGNLDTAAKTFLLRTVTVSYSATVVYKNGSEANLAKDVNVDVYGVLSADRTKLQAQRIEFKK
jgi:Domain of unknown function (DUF5666)